MSVGKSGLTVMTETATETATDIVKMNSDADVERIIADEIISGGKITKVLTPTML